MKSIKQTLKSLTASQLLDDAKSYIRNGSYYEALHAVNAYLLFQPHNEEGILTKGLCYLYLNEADKARFLFDLVLAQNPAHAYACYCYAEYFKLQFAYTDALYYINAAMAADGEDSNYYRLAAEISYFKGDYSDAYQVINRAIVVSPFRAELYVWRALILDKLKQTAVAIHDLTRATSIQPQYAEAYRIRAKFQLRMGNTEQALIDLHKSQQLNRLFEERKIRTAFAA